MLPRLWQPGMVGLARLRDASGRLWRWLTEVRAADPVQLILSQGFAVLILLTTVCTLLMIPISSFSDEGPVLLACLVSLPVDILVWWLNRRGRLAGPLLYTLWILLTLLVGMDPHDYVGPNTPIPLVLIMPVVIATFFVRPRAGPWTALLVMALFGLRIELSGMPRDQSLRFMLIGTINMVALTSFMSIAAAIALRALRASITTNESLVRLNVALSAAEEKYRSLVENAIEGIYRIAPDETVMAANPAMARMLGYDSPADLMQLGNLSSHIFIDPGRRADITRLLEEHGFAQQVELQVCRRDRSPIWALMDMRIVRDEQGQILYYEGTARDISERKELESQLRQAQKMEAIGRLAGGVAHDFNNLLTVILSYAQLAQLNSSQESPLLEDLRQIEKAAERAAALTQQLLAFSRRQVLQPSLLNANAVVQEVIQMLQRLIGEDIELQTRLDPRLSVVLADHNQTQQALLNLAVNARDAMPQGGRLTIETANVELPEQETRLRYGAPAGAYVMVALSDTGHGMDHETQARIFEPFFTSKPVGQGTGLGLAMVHGFVTQSGGFIEVESEPGHGSTFRIYLPRAQAQEVAAAPPTRVSSAGGSETILLVEDDPMVRVLARQILDQQGYHVLEAAQGAEALDLLDAAGEVDLVITDVVMPGGLSGPQVVERMLRLSPTLRVLYISGYANSTIVQHGELKHAFLQKPFSPESLACKVREVLDQGPGIRG